MFRKRGETIELSLMTCEVDFTMSGEDRMDASSAGLRMVEGILEEPVFVKLLGFPHPNTEPTS